MVVADELHGIGNRFNQILFLDDGHGWQSSVSR
jgi:hypothetical protein